MTTPTTDRDALIEALAENARSRGGEEVLPEPEEILDFLEDRLPPARRAELERLFVASPEAAAMLVDLAELHGAEPPAADAPADFAVRAGWRKLEGRLTEPAAAPRRLPPRWLGLAASALILTNAGLGLWVWRLKQAESRPVANLASLELGSGLRAGTDPTLELALGSPLRLVVKPPEPCPVYQAEVRGPGDQGRQTVAGLEQDGFGNLVLLLRLEAGDYVLRLSGCEPRRELESYRFTIAPLGGG
ncbi:MAG TPA: hypothetical protein VF017_22910 [Thermoanaerobaculia bacterium]|nr:hypothetical protein [Thermoanaerobaculia bacterium]